MKSSLVLIIAIAGLVLICYLALNHYILFKIVMFFIIGYIVFFFAWVNVLDYQVYAAFIRMLKISFNGNVAKNNYSEKQVFFDFEKSKFEFYSQLVWVPYQYGGHMGVSSHRMNYLKLQAQNDLSLFIWKKTGNTIIGRATDKILSLITANGCQEVRIPLPPLFENYKVYSNNEIKAGYFLSDADVYSILFKNMNTGKANWQSPGRLYIQRGIVTLDGFLTKSDPVFLRSILSDMKLLANKLSGGKDD